MLSPDRPLPRIFNGVIPSRPANAPFLSTEIWETYPAGKDYSGVLCTSTTGVRLVAEMAQSPRGSDRSTVIGTPAQSVDSS